MGIGGFGEGWDDFYGFFWIVFMVVGGVGRWGPTLMKEIKNRWITTRVAQSVER